MATDPLDQAYWREHAERELDYYGSCWEASRHNPVYAWNAVRVATRHSLKLPDWVLSYLSACANEVEKIEHRWAVRGATEKLPSGAERKLEVERDRDDVWQGFGFGGLRGKATAFTTLSAEHSDRRILGEFIRFKNEHPGASDDRATREIERKGQSQGTIKAVLKRVRERHASRQRHRGLP